MEFPDQGEIHLYPARQHADFADDSSDLLAIDCERLTLRIARLKRDIQIAITDTDNGDLLTLNAAASQLLFPEDTSQPSQLTSLFGGMSAAHILLILPALLQEHLDAHPSDASIVAEIARSLAPSGPHHFQGETRGANSWEGDVTYSPASIAQLRQLASH